MLLTTFYLKMSFSEVTGHLVNVVTESLISPSTLDSDVIYKQPLTESVCAWIWGLFTLSLRLTCSSTADADDFRRLTRCRLPEMRPWTQHRTLFMKCFSFFVFIYSQTCLQRPLLRPKSNSDCWQVVVDQRWLDVGKVQYGTSK